MVSGGIDPHMFEPGPREVKQVRSAKILFANGLYFEPWLDNLVKTASNDLTLIYASKEVKVRKMKDGDKLTKDPHAWNSPAELIVYIKVITDALVKNFPDKSSSIKQRSSKFIKKVRAINTKFSRGFSKVKAENQVMLTTHDAAGYIADTFGIKSISPLGLSTAEDFKTADLKKLLEQIKAYKVKVIFTEPNHHKILSERLAQKTQLKLGPELYLDGLSPKGGPADTVEKMLNHNLSLILASMK